MSTAPLVQVVRRFGPVGGMESYVWHLCHELARLGQPVTVLCESRHAEPVHPAIRVLPLGAPRLARPRWRAYLAFSRTVAWRLAQPDLQGAIVHSHERCGSHDVTTFHSEPFDQARSRRRLGWLSPRFWAYRWMEQRELGLAHARAVQVVPVSSRVADLLQQAYPALKDRLQAPIPPGVASPRSLQRARDPGIPAGVVGFVGREWKRKGLPLALRIVSQLRRERPGLHLKVLGPPAEEVQPLCLAAGLGGDAAQCLGWRDPDPELADIDLLLHPARSEAYGMVIAEAMARGVPVVVSDRCGAAAEVDAARGSVVALHAPLQDWVSACKQWLAAPAPGSRPLPARTWQEVAHDYLALYERVRATRR